MWGPIWGTPCFPLTLQFTDNDLNSKIAKLEQNHCYEINMVNQKLRDLEDRSRRNNLRIDGVPESDKESWDDTESKINDLLKDKLDLEGIDIERAHRGKLTKYQKDNNQPRTIVMKLLNYKDKVKILKNARRLKDTGIYINEDFSKETTEIRKRLWEQVKKLRDQGKYAIIKYDQIYQRDFKN